MNLELTANEMTITQRELFCREVTDEDREAYGLAHEESQRQKSARRPKIPFYERCDVGSVKKLVAERIREGSLSLMNHGPRLTYVDSIPRSEGVDLVVLSWPRVDDTDREIADEIFMNIMVGVGQLSVHGDTTSSDSFLALLNGLKKLSVWPRSMLIDFVGFMYGEDNYIGQIIIRVRWSDEILPTPTDPTKDL